MLTPEADRLWSFLKERRTLAGFVLLGVSALSLRIDQFELALARLCSGKAPAHDEGPGLDEIAEFYQRERDVYESSEAQSARERGRPSDSI